MELQNCRQVGQAQLIGQLKITGCASPWSVNTTSMSAFPVQTGCVYFHEKTRPEIFQQSETDSADGVSGVVFGRFA
jgi:hypothetical protein